VNPAGAAMLLGQVLEAIAVDRHHAGFSAGEECRNTQQHDQQTGE